jgi:hypothetical protein
MDFRVGRVLELLRHEAAGPLGEQFLGALDGACHAALGRRQHDLGAERAQHLAPLDAHRGRHGQRQPIATRGAHESQRDAGVARRRLDDLAARRKTPAFLRGVDHGEPDAVLHRRQRVEKFELG